MLTFITTLRLTIPISQPQLYSDRTLTSYWINFKTLENLYVHSYNGGASVFALEKQSKEENFHYFT